MLSLQSGRLTGELPTGQPSEQLTRLPRTLRTGLRSELLSGQLAEPRARLCRGFPGEQLTNRSTRQSARLNPELFTEPCAQPSPKRGSHLHPTELKSPTWNSLSARTRRCSIPQIRSITARRPSNQRTRKLQPLLARVVVVRWVPVLQAHLLALIHIYAHTPRK